MHTPRAVPGAPGTVLPRTRTGAPAPARSDPAMHAGECLHANRGVLRHRLEMGGHPRRVSLRLRSTVGQGPRPVLLHQLERALGSVRTGAAPPSRRPDERPVAVHIREGDLGRARRLRPRTRRAPANGSGPEPALASCAVTARRPVRRFSTIGLRRLTVSGTRSPRNAGKANDAARCSCRKVSRGREVQTHCWSRLSPSLPLGPGVTSRGAVPTGAVVHDASIASVRPILSP